MWYVKNKIGYGLQYRHFDAIVGLIHFKFSNMSIGYAFDYTLSRMRWGSSNTHEVMISLSPCMGHGHREPPRHCPAYD